MELTKDSVFSLKFPFETDPFDIRKYFSEYSELLIPFENCSHEKCKRIEGSGCNKANCKNDAFYAKFLGISKEQLLELKERASIEHLKCEGEMKQLPVDFYKNHTNTKDALMPPLPIDNDDEDVPLEEINKPIIPKPVKSEFHRTFFKYCNYQWHLSNDRRIVNKLDFSCDDFSRVVACVKVYHPFTSNKNKKAKIKLMQEIMILGHQKLSFLKDKILCCTDFVGTEDLSSDYFLKEVGVERTAKDEYPSSFIFIENTFYNDTRSPKMVDLSKGIIEWSKGRGIGPFDSKSMENTVLSTLKVRLGHPYMYQHQGGCEHLIVFSDIRFLEVGDPIKLSSYPKIHCTGRYYGRHCWMCSDAYARWLVVGNERLTHEKTYLCKKCFFSYNYINGRKIGEFRAYKYVDPIAIL